MTPTEDVLIAKQFINATVSIFSTMAGLTPVVGRPFVKKEAHSIADITAIIGVTGDRPGTIAVSFQKEAAMQLLTAMLGDDINDPQADMEDIVGEVTNMISGQARAALDGLGIKLQGSTPSVISGKHPHHVSHKAGGVVICIPFELEKGSLVVEFCFKN